MKRCNVHILEGQPQEDLPSLKEYTRRHFGIMQSAEPVEAVLRFSPQSAGWVSEQIWHPEQKTTVEADGSLLLQFTVADFHEMVKKIMSHCAEVKVGAPKELQNLVREEINKMAKIYFHYDIG
ncbi:MAG: WYL domain-containing protein [Proteobacteria bacterium]|nr:WYL domain-containing protein [Pseudomonadota bacterium]MBU4296138.1 WYL domain-containing protein [Pseudomonadota bacterium]MCG2747456.1 WYL domain-containing protein [Desulfobulbaceae bacterium]